VATRYDHAGGAVETTLAATITGGDTSATITAATGWPSGGASGPFFIVADPGLAGEEKIQVASRTGTTLSSLTRGVDGTAASGHTLGATVKVIFPALEAHQSSEHAGNTALDEHTQYLNTARHAAIPHTAAMLGTDSVGSDEIAAGAVGSTELASNAVTAGKIATGGISAAAQFAAGVVDSAAILDGAVGSAEIGTNAVGSDEIATNAVGTPEIADLAVTSAKLAAGAAGPGKIGTGAVDASFNIVDGVVTLAKIASEASTDFGPSMTLTGVTLGTGGDKYARYWKLGRLVLMLAGFQLGTGGSVSASIQFSLPFTPADRATGFTIPITGGFTAGSARDDSSSLRYSGIGTIRSDLDTATDYVIAASGDAWDNNSPFVWAVNDTLEIIAVYESTT
jgi:hypothetical protein